MTITLYEPWTPVNDFHKEIGRLFGGQRISSPASNDASNDANNVVTSHWTPAVDVKEASEQFTIFVDVPGIDNNAIDISMDKGVLSIKGERHSERTNEATGEDTEDSRYLRVERAHGTFFRSFSLPETADANGIRAQNKNGVLIITIPKQPVSQPQKIAIED